jgi:transposase
MRKGFDGLAALVREKLRHDPFSGQIFVFRGRRGGANQGAVALTAAQLGMLLEGIDDWRMPVRTWRPTAAG